jgi:competence ComEA-like helix-hairpin-helix protein
MLWVAVIAGCIWYFATARGIRTIDIDTAPAKTAQFLVEINSASKHEFDCLPGIGPKTAAAITRWREEHGPFQSIDSLIDVPGVSERLLEKVKPFLYHDLEQVTQR